MSTNGWEDGPPTVTGVQTGDSGTGIHTVASILAALYQREQHTGKGQRIVCTMQDSVLNLCRVKMRDQQRLAHGPLTEYPNKTFNGVVPRSGNASGGGQPGAALKCAPGGTNDYVYLIIQPQVWKALCEEMGRPELVTDPRFATPAARLPILEEVWAIVEEWTKKYTKYEILDRCNAIDVPCGPVMDMGRAARRRIAARAQHGRRSAAQRARHVLRSAARSTSPIHRWSTKRRRCSENTAPRSSAK